MYFVFTSFILVLFCKLANKEFYHMKIVENIEIPEKEWMGMKSEDSVLVTWLIYVCAIYPWP